MRLVGVTGGVGAGKSEVLNYIKKHYKCRIYLADEVAHLVKAKGEDCYYELVSLLGEEILLPDGEINKSAMAAKIFADDALLEKVNEIVHPQVRIYLEKRIKEAKEDPDTEIMFIEAALLIEAGYKELVDELWYIYADVDVRKVRLMSSRGYSEEKIRQIMEAQLSEDVFRKESDFVIDNSGTLADSYRQIRKKLKGFTWVD